MELKTPFLLGYITKKGFLKETNEASPNVTQILKFLLEKVYKDKDSQNDV